MRSSCHAVSPFAARVRSSIFSNSVVLIGASEAAEGNGLVASMRGNSVRRLARASQYSGVFLSSAVLIDIEGDGNGNAAEH